MITNYFFAFFYQVNNLFLHQSYLKAHSLQIILIKNAKNHFLLFKKLKNTESAQLCSETFHEGGNCANFSSSMNQSNPATKPARRVYVCVCVCVCACVCVCVLLWLGG